ncbi:nuclear localization sequence binding protein [Knufia fluminis]|uniref:Nuclear localization sequence binding protein n=1 Tax=Knufia fluminis TaxID=191047 RepID=A0AAN8EKU7_9EURO|nr:nuclear localization sequence binding protein [Knufia fluminis]
MSKTKSSTKAAKPTKDVLTKVKDAGIKGTKDTKSKNKEVAKKVAEKEEKKGKKSKKVKEPTPEPSSEEEDESSESSSSESESEVETKKPVANGKTKKTAAKDESSDSSEAESSDESESSEDEAPAPKKAADKKVADKKSNGVKVAAKKEESSDESESDSSSDEATTAPAAGVLGKAPAVDDASDSSDESESSDDEAEVKPKANGAKKAESSDDDSSDESSEEEEEEKPATKANKRKAEEEPERAVKKAKAEAEGTDSAGSKNLFVGNLSWNVDEDMLRETFGEHGELTGVRVMYDRATQRAKGFGYVEFANASDAAAAYKAKKGFGLDGREMNVDWASVKPDNPNKMQDRRQTYGDQLSEPSDTLFVGNLSFDVGQEQVSEAFAPYGTIMSVRLPTDQQTGSPKGFGYVTFSSIEETKAALEAMQGGYVGSRPIRLDYSQPRPERQDGGFGGGRGGGRGGFGGRGRGGDRGRGGFGGRGRGGDRGRGGRGSFGGRGGSTNRGGFDSIIAWSALVPIPPVAEVERDDHRTPPSVPRCGIISSIDSGETTLRSTKVAYYIISPVRSTSVREGTTDKARNRVLESVYDFQIRSWK